MASVTSALIFCCMFFGTIISAAYIQPLPSEQVQDGQLLPQTRKPDVVLVTLCWDGRNVLDECRKNSPLMKQMLYKLLFKLRTEPRRSQSEAYTDDEDSQESHAPAKRAREDASGFYSNW